MCTGTTTACISRHACRGGVGVGHQPGQRAQLLDLMLLFVYDVAVSSKHRTDEYWWVEPAHPPARTHARTAQFLATAASPLDIENRARSVYHVRAVLTRRSDEERCKACRPEEHTLTLDYLQARRQLLGLDPLPWEDGLLMPPAQQRLGHLWTPLLRMLCRDPAQRASCADFAAVLRSASPPEL